MADSFQWPPRDLAHYLQLHRQSLERRERFWAEQARQLDWRRDFDEVVEEDMTATRVNWFSGGRLCPAANALRNHGDRPALVYLDHRLRFHELDGRQLAKRVRRAGAALAAAGLEPGGRLLLYLPNIPETVILALAAAWLGATLVPVPARFAPEQVADIAANCGAGLVVVAGGYALADYNQRVEQLVGILPADTARLLRVGREIPGVERLYSESVGESEQREVGAEHPLALLYAGSATGIPRGSVLPSAGLLVQAGMVHRLLLRFGEPEQKRLAVYCAIDLASAAGLAHGLWGPLLNGDTVVLAGTRTHAAGQRLARLAERFAELRVITSPDRLEEWTGRPDADPLPQALGLVASCQDTLTPRLAARAGAALVSRPCRVVNLWVQNESGCGLIASFPSEPLNRPGALGLPLPGVSLRVVGEDGRDCARNRGGRLVFDKSWPAMARNIWGQPQRYLDTYFSELPGHFTTRDAVRRDREGFVWFMARRDDVVKARGLSLRTGEIEALLQAQSGVVEAAVVGAPGGDHGEELVAFVVVEAAGELVGRETVVERLQAAVQKRLGPLAVPQRLVLCEQLPRTETGKLARTLLRRLAAGHFDEPVHQLENPQALVALRQALEG